MSNSPHRSFEQIKIDDIARLGQIALNDFDDLFVRSEYSRPYKGKLRLICLCQGAAQHYIHGDRGIHDFDMWGFFKAIANHPFPYRRMGSQDFGASRFGRNPDDGPSFEGRRVDVIGRSISMPIAETPIESVQRYLRERATESALLLSERPVVVAWPDKDLGRVIWNPPCRRADTAPPDGYRRQAGERGLSSAVSGPNRLFPTWQRWRARKSSARAELGDDLGEIGR